MKVHAYHLSKVHAYHLSKLDAYDISCRISMPMLSYIMCTCLPCVHMPFALKDVCMCRYQDIATDRYGLEGTRCRRIAPRAYLQVHTSKCIGIATHRHSDRPHLCVAATHRCGLIPRHACGMIPRHTLESCVSRAYLSVCKGICVGMAERCSKKEAARKRQAERCSKRNAAREMQRERCRQKDAARDAPNATHHTQEFCGYGCGQGGVWTHLCSPG